MIKTPVRYCDEDWMLYDADGDWLASLDAGEAGPEIRDTLNKRPTLIAQRDALAQACESICGDLSPDGFSDDELVVVAMTGRELKAACAALALVRGEKEIDSELD